MGFFFRKSINAGPFRLNFSKHGMGGSVGVTGFRLGMKPDGQKYLQVGRHGFYYRKTLPRNNPAAPPTDPDPDTTVHSDALADDPPAVTATPEAAVPPAPPATRSESTLVDMLNAKLADSPAIDRKAKLHMIILGTAGISGLTALLNGFILFPLLAGFIAYAAWKKLQQDQAARITRVDYALSPACQEAFAAFVEQFRQFIQIDDLWVVSDQYANGETIGYASATYGIGTPDHVMMNLEVPFLAGRTHTLWFFPDQIIVQDTSGFAALRYADLIIEATLHSVREDGAVPADGKQTGATWLYPNMDGSQDHRHKNNRIIPVMEYEIVRMTDRHQETLGIWMLSKSGQAQIFQQAIKACADRLAHAPDSAIKIAVCNVQPD